MPESRFPPIVMLLLLIAALCIYGIILQPGATFAGMDFLNLGYPRVKLSRDAFLAGHIPLWNWYDWGGAPLLASMLGAVLYPPTWLSMLFPLPYGLQLFVFCHLLFAGIGAWLVGRKVFGLSHQAGLICGLLYMGNSFFTGRIEQFQVIAVNSLLPWLILSTVSAWHGRKAGLWLPIAWLATLFAGHPQFAVFNAITAVCITIFPVSKSWLTRKCGAGLLRIAVGFVLGTGMAAIQLMPTWELSRLSERIWPYPDPTLPELSWANLPALVVPHYYNFISGQSGRAFGYTELGLYAGILAVPLAITGLVSSFRQKQSDNKTIVVAGILWALAMIFALGSNGGIAPLIFEYVPFFKNSRGAARSLNIASLMLAVLAGRGVMAIAAARLFKSARRQWAMPIVLFALFVVDIAAQNFSVINSIMVSTATLSTKPLMPSDTRESLQQQPIRLYRFMAYDSDLYLNNSQAAVAERIMRTQPNLNGLSGIALVDGYEEGLLPTRSRANLFRRFNRNLRTDSPDASLLGILQSNLMFTEFPLPLPDESWQRASPPYPRPVVVPRPGNQPTDYTYWKSAYDPAMFLDLALLVKPADYGQFLAESVESFPLNNSKSPMSTHWTHHPFERFSPAQIAAASAPFSLQSDFARWNSLAASVASGTTQALVMMPPYPGWKPAEKNNVNCALKNLCSVFSLVHLSDIKSAHLSLHLIFSPFSFRLGSFIALVCLSAYLQVCLSWVKISVRNKETV